MGVKQELIDKHGQDVRIVTKRKGPYDVHVAVRDFDDGTTRTVAIRSEKNRPAILGYDKFFDVKDIPMVFGSTQADEVKEVIDRRL
jgi:hypothetical protein